MMTTGLIWPRLLPRLLPNLSSLLLLLLLLMNLIPHCPPHQFDPVCLFSLVASTSSQAPQGKKKRARKTAYSLSVAEEEVMLDFLRDNPILWDIKKMDYRNKQKKDKLWDDQARAMGKTPDHLQGWFKSLRDTNTRLDKKKTGDGAPDLTERDAWILANFVFLKQVVRYRPEPVKSVSINKYFI